MATGGSGYWQDLSSEQFEASDHAAVIAVLPVGAIEQHGPHLPLGVDALINQGIVERAMAQLPGHLQVLVLPMMPVGKSDEHVDFAGTLTLDAETVTRLWTEIGLSVARAGVRKLVLFNSHGGQTAIMDIVARDLRIREKMLVMAYSWFAAGLPDGLFPNHELQNDIHAGVVETSMMLHLRPELVDMSKASDFQPLMTAMAKEGYRRLTPVGAGRMGWQAQDLHASGAAGNAAAADPESGRRLVDHAANALVELLVEMDRFSPSRLADRTPPEQKGGMRP